MTKSRLARSWLVWATALALTCAAVTGAQRAETPSAGAPGLVAFEPPRTPWGDPDLRGTWPSAPMIEVPFERPASFGTRAVLTDEEFAKRAAEVQAQADSDRAETDTGAGIPLAPPPHWLERGEASRQASLVVDPPNGRLPPMTAGGARRAERWRATSAPGYPVERPEEMRPYDRCITRGVLGSAFPNIYGTGMQILQAPGAVVIRYEMIHETRIIPLDGRPHIPVAIRSYMGDPRGHWESDTLVVETTNFNGKTGSYGRNGDGNPTSDALRLVERFRLRDADTLQYEVTVYDPQTWTRPWTVAFPLTRDEGYTMYEYACHEGNYALANILKAARAADRNRSTER